MPETCLFCKTERDGISEPLFPIFYEQNDNMRRIEDSFYCKIHGIVVEDLGGYLRKITLEKSKHGKI